MKTTYSLWYWPNYLLSPCYQHCSSQYQFVGNLHWKSHDDQTHWPTKVNLQFAHWHPRGQRSCQFTQNSNSLNATLTLRKLPHVGRSYRQTDKYAFHLLTSNNTKNVTKAFTSLAVLEIVLILHANWINGFSAIYLLFLGVPSTAVSWWLLFLIRVMLDDLIRP